MFVNGITSGITGIILILFSQFFSNLFQVSTAEPFIATGVFLTLFAGLVIWIAGFGSDQKMRVAFIIILDSLWSIVSILFVIFFNHEISMIGNILIVAVAAWVATMAFLQNKGLKQIPFKKI
jgi:hypothetical protein